VKSLRKGLLVALLHLIIVSSLGARLLYDRVHRPRIWVKVANYDPDLPIRGRYLSLNLEIPTEGIIISRSPQSYDKDKDGQPLYFEHPNPYRCDLVFQNGTLIAVGNELGNYGLWVRQRAGQPSVIVVDTRTPFFIPEHLETGAIRAAQELWMEATIPRKGPPRPIRLAMKKDGVLMPFAIR
jgi:hypothetical protein